jgi:Putative DNA-binding domain
VTLGSFVHGALAELTIEDLDRMLTLDETLFVEHKADLGDQSSHQLARSVSAFANTLGGWLLIGVTDGKPNRSSAPWTSDDGPTLVDAVRDRLRDLVDPLPPFEARRMQHSDGTIGVVRVYESTDTPHVSLQSGAVFVREGAGVTDAARHGKSGAGARAQRTFEARQIRSRQQLLDLAARGAQAERRVQALLDPARPLPLTNRQLALSPPGSPLTQGEPYMTTRGATIFVRLAPLTLPARFRSWVTTTDGAAALIGAAEQLSMRRGLTGDWATPHPDGASLQIEMLPGAMHHDAAQMKLKADARLTLDAAGVAGAALSLRPPDEPGLRPRVNMNELADKFIVPVIQGALRMLVDGEFLGRARCQIDLWGLAVTVALSEGGQSPADWTSHTSDIAVPPDAAQIVAIARLASYAHVRSAGVRGWDPPIGA